MSTLVDTLAAYEGNFAAGLTEDAQGAQSKTKWDNIAFKDMLRLMSPEEEKECRL